ncbi:unnamed protein product [Clonostachys chloroleuca]|uniref:Uncharacterized protein n=1 Tax=Clonostachys chloroleuca TaxID=1926264 RepID=A0AA35Q4Q1_9HYPO|nr:unnamed protein product [Clonostachys chloroleuca]
MSTRRDVRRENPSNLSRRPAGHAETEKTERPSLRLDDTNAWGKIPPGSPQDLNTAPEHRQDTLCVQGGSRCGEAEALPPRIQPINGMRSGRFGVY